MRPRVSRATSRVDLNCTTEPSLRTMVRSILTTPLNGAFGMGVIKKLCAEARVEGIATANRTVQETEVRDNRVGIRNLQRHSVTTGYSRSRWASKVRVRGVAGCGGGPPASGGLGIRLL